MTTAFAPACTPCPDCGLRCRLAGHGAAAPACPRCGAPVHALKPRSLERTWAFVIAAAACYLPANALPIMKVTSLGRAQADTILSGVVYLLTHVGVGLVARASAANSDICVDYIRMTAYYLYAEGAFGVNPDQNWQAQVSDAGSLTFSGGDGSTPITATEATQLQVSDAASLGVWTPIAGTEGAQLQVSDPAVLGVWTRVAPAQNFQAQVSDAATMGVYSSRRPSAELPGASIRRGNAWGSNTHRRHGSSAGAGKRCGYTQRYLSDKRNRSSAGASQRRRIHHV